MPCARLYAGRRVSVWTDVNISYRIVSYKCWRYGTISWLVQWPVTFGTCPVLSLLHLLYQIPVIHYGSIIICKVQWQGECGCWDDPCCCCCCCCCCWWWWWWWWWSILLLLFNSCCFVVLFMMMMNFDKLIYYKCRRRHCCCCCWLVATCINHTSPFSVSK